MLHVRLFNWLRVSCNPLSWFVMLHTFIKALRAIDVIRILFIRLCILSALPFSQTSLSIFYCRIILRIDHRAKHVTHHVFFFIACFTYIDIFQPCLLLVKQLLTNLLRYIFRFFLLIFDRLNWRWWWWCHPRNSNIMSYRTILDWYRIFLLRFLFLFLFWLRRILLWLLWFLPHMITLLILIVFNYR